MAEPVIRPPQVTVAGMTVVAASVMVVLSGFETVSSLHSLQTTQAIEKLLAEPGGSGLGLGVDGVRRVIRVATTIAVGCATATTILGWQALRRSRAARVVLTVLAVPLVVAGAATDVFFATIAAAATVMLWVSPARQWFDGTWRPEPAGARRGSSSAPPTPPAAPYTPPAAPYTPPVAPPITPPITPPGVPPGTPPTYGPPGGYARRPHLGRRPSALTTACVLTWVFAGSAAFAGFFAVSVLTTNGHEFLAQLRRSAPQLFTSGVGDDRIIWWCTIGGTVTVVWSLAAVLLAGFAIAGRGWARPALMACAGLTAAVCAGLLTRGIAVAFLPLGGAVATLVLLARADVRAWYAAARHRVVG